MGIEAEAMGGASAPAPTRLARQLDGTEVGKVGPVDAFKLARRSFIAGERIDMSALADQLGVDRATLFRWVGNRNQLLVEVIWSVSQPTWRSAVQAANGIGADRVADAFAGFVRDVTEAAYFRTYLRREKERALRLLTSKQSQHQERVTADFEALLIEEQQAGNLTLPLTPHDIAYVMTRIAESFIYSDLITGEPPDADKAAAVVGAMLGAHR